MLLATSWSASRQPLVWKTRRLWFYRLTLTWCLRKTATWFMILRKIPSNLGLLTAGCMLPTRPWGPTMALVWQPPWLYWQLPTYLTGPSKPFLPSMRKLAWMALLVWNPKPLRDALSSIWIRKTKANSLLGVPVVWTSMWPLLVRKECLYPMVTSLFACRWPVWKVAIQAWISTWAGLMPIKASSTCWKTWLAHWGQD